MKQILLLKQDTERKMQTLACGHFHMIMCLQWQHLALVLAAKLFHLNKDSKIAFSGVTKIDPMSGHASCQATRNSSSLAEDKRPCTKWDRLQQPCFKQQQQRHEHPTIAAPIPEDYEMSCHLLKHEVCFPSHVAVSSLGALNRKMDTHGQCTGSLQAAFSSQGSSRSGTLSHRHWV